MYRYIFIYYLLISFGNFFIARDVFAKEQESLCETSPAVTESVPSTLVANAVSVITGDFVDSEVDMVIPGPEPLVLERTYSSQDRSYGHLYNGWTLMHPTELTIWDLERKGSRKSRISHRNAALEYNKEWQVFINECQEATKAQILQEGRKIMSSYGISLNY